MIAAMTHPHFKTRWIHEQYRSKKNMDEVRDLLISKALTETDVDFNANGNRHGEQAGGQESNGNYIYLYTISKNFIECMNYIYI